MLKHGNSIAVQSELNNLGAQGQGYGLQIKCNDMLNSKICHINVTGVINENSVTYPASLRNQGYLPTPSTDPTAAANNILKDTPMEKDIRTYLYDNALPFSYYFPKYYVPWSDVKPTFNDVNNILPKMTAASTISCPVPQMKIGTGNFSMDKSVKEISHQMEELKDLVAQEKITLAQTIDGGNTAQLLGMINSGLPLHKTLLQYSPYLSDTV